MLRVLPSISAASIQFLWQESGDRAREPRQCGFIIAIRWHIISNAAHEALPSIEAACKLQKSLLAPCSPELTEVLQNIRQDWSKWTLYNLSRAQEPFTTNRTFFQQKWTAKSLLRAYHNPDVREGTWTRLFDRRLPAVVPMDHKYLARFDGSEMASGRGMGADKEPRKNFDERDRRGQRDSERAKSTPYMHMTFHPLERRLDTAIFRALFASSTRQARQFVTHGWVKVNGKKMLYPSYQLNPGDMFSVDPERVMFATGAPKKGVPKPEGEEAADEGEDVEAKEGEAEAEAEAETSSDLKAAEAAPAEPESKDPKGDAKKALKELMEQTRSILESAKDDLSGKRQRELRDLSRNVRKLLSQYRGVAESDLNDNVEELKTSLTEILGKVPENTLAQTNTSEGVDSAKSSNPQMSDSAKVDNYQARKDAELLAQALERIRENPYDETKPYATPWRPRPYMSAFAFIPRYLEVNQNICSAVYLRHPVARPGLAEVPTPYGNETMALAFNWYLRRR